jgi:hypothetical protein
MASTETTKAAPEKVSEALNMIPTPSRGTGATVGAGGGGDGCTGQPQGRQIHRPVAKGTSIAQRRRQQEHAQPQLVEAAVRFELQSGLSSQHVSSIAKRGMPQAGGWVNQQELSAIHYTRQREASV